MHSVSTTTATPIVAPDHFLLATRDAGYRNLASALTELIDNSLQAGATRVSVLIEEIDGIPAADFTNRRWRSRQRLRYGCLSVSPRASVWREQPI